MLYFVVGNEPNEQEFPWHVGSSIPRLGRVNKIYADGHELEHLQRLGFAIERTTGGAQLFGDRANSALRAMRLHASSKTETPKPSIGLGDVVRIGDDTNPFPDHTVSKINEDGTVNLFRPYVHTADFSYTGGVICYVGISQTDSVNPERLTLVQKGQPLK